MKILSCLGLAALALGGSLGLGACAGAKAAPEDAVDDVPKSVTSLVDASSVVGACPDSKSMNARAATNAITIPASVLDRWHGPAVIQSGDVIPRNALEGLALHKVDVHLTKDFKIAGTSRVQLIAEVFNLLNHANYGAYNTTLSATVPATTALFGTPNQNGGNAYVPRMAQLGFKLVF